MRIFVAGATGAIGRQLVPMLVGRGHDVVGMTRTAAKVAQLRDAGAHAVVADALDPSAVGRAIGEAGPDVVVHQLTAIPSSLNMRHFDSEFAATNRLRVEGTDNLLSAARAAGVGRFVAQSNATVYARSGTLKCEADPLDLASDAPNSRGVAAIRHLEDAVLAATWMVGVVLRYGWLYGPGTSLARVPLGQQVELLAKRQLPIIGDGAGVWSLVHVTDAARATVAAVEGGSAGVYNVVDDDPAPVSEFLPALAEVLGAKPPRRIPRWVGRLAAGPVAVAAMTEIRGATNAKAKRDLGWTLEYPTWREGFRKALG